MTSTETHTPTLSGERADLLDALAKHRFFLRNSTRGLTEEQVAAAPTASSLCLGGLIKHVAHGERQWVDFILAGPAQHAGHADIIRETLDGAKIMA